MVEMLNYINAQYVLLLLYFCANVQWKHACKMLQIVHDIMTSLPMQLWPSRS
jgi:hypothetical protein